MSAIKIKPNMGAGPFTRENLRILEAQLGCELPDDYRDFLLKHNGGQPDRCFFTSPSDGQDDWIDNFFSVDENYIQPNEEADTDTISFATFMDGRFMPEDCLIIGSASQMNRILLRLHGERRGRVDLKVMGNLDVSDDEDYPDKIRELEVYPLAESFAEFLAALRLSDSP